MSRAIAQGTCQRIFGGFALTLSLIHCYSCVIMFTHCNRFQEDEMNSPTVVELVAAWDADNCAEDDWKGQELVAEMPKSLKNAAGDACDLWLAVNRGIFLCAGPHHGPITLLCIFGVCMALPSMAAVGAARAGRRTSWPGPALPPSARL